MAVDGRGHLHGYARVSTAEQDPALQHDALTAAGCARVWTDVASGGRDDRPELARLLEQLLPGDTLVVWRLDRLGRSLRHLIDVVTALDQRGSGGRVVFHLFAALAEFERDLIRIALWPGSRPPAPAAATAADRRRWPRRSCARQRGCRPTAPRSPRSPTPSASAAPPSTGT